MIEYQLYINQSISHKYWQNIGILLMMKCMNSVHLAMERQIDI